MCACVCDGMAWLQPLTAITICSNLTFDLFSAVCRNSCRHLSVTLVLSVVYLATKTIAVHIKRLPVCHFCVILSLLPIRFMTIIKSVTCAASGKSQVMNRRRRGLKRLTHPNTVVIPQKCSRKCQQVELRSFAGNFVSARSLCCLLGRVTDDSTASIMV